MRKNMLATSSRSIHFSEVCVESSEKLKFLIRHKKKSFQFFAVFNLLFFLFKKFCAFE